MRDLDGHHAVPVDLQHADHGAGLGDVDAVPARLVEARVGVVAAGVLVPEAPLTGATVQEFSLPRLAPAFYTWSVRTTDGAVRAGKVMVP